MVDSYTRKPIFDEVDLILYTINKARIIEGYLKPHRIMFLVKDKVKSLGYEVDLDFNNILLNGPYSNDLEQKFNCLDGNYNHNRI